MKRVLVVYASKYGSTAEIASAIAEEIRSSGLQVDLKPAQLSVNLADYDAVVLGSAVYAGSWMVEAAVFLKHFEHKLASRPVWLFSSGPTGAGDPIELLKGWYFPEVLQPVVDRINPRDIALFHGKIDMDKLHWGERLILRAVKGEVGDSRDWEAIRTWAQTIAAELAAAPETSP